MTDSVRGYRSPMTVPLKLRFYLEDGLRRSASAGQHNFINKIADVATRAGYEIEYCTTPKDGAARSDDGAHTLTHMKPPQGPNGLTFRRVYHYPFWQIEQSDKRWEWAVARAPFDPSQAPRKTAQQFFERWKRRLYADLPGTSSDQGFIYIPLQGRLLQHRSFQHCTPLQMIERTRRAFPTRRIIVTLHPKEIYDEAEIAAVDRLQSGDPNMQVHLGQMETFLPHCSLVVAQNSSAAFAGYFFEKPAVLFARIDFHHIALRGSDPDVFVNALDHRPDYPAYIWWFWQHQSINAGHSSAEDKIADRLRSFGWPI